MTASSSLSARARLLVATSVGVIVAIVVAFVGAWQISVLLGWCGLALTFDVWVWSIALRADGPTTRRIATREDDSRVMADAILVLASVASLVGVVVGLVKANDLEGVASALLTIVGVLSVVLAWATVHTTFTLRYAHLYYRDGGGVDFNEHRDPDYHDFAYLAFTIGMTYQVSDTDITSPAIRRAALRHALVSFLFGTAIIAVTINVVANLLH